MDWNQPLCGKCKQPIVTPGDALLMAMSVHTTYWHLNCWETERLSNPLASRAKLFIPPLDMHEHRITLQGEETPKTSPTSRREKLQDLIVQDCSKMVTLGVVLEGLFVFILYLLVTQPLQIPMVLWAVFLLLGLIPLWMVASPCLFWMRLARLERMLAVYGGN